MEALEDADGRRRPVSVVIGIVSFLKSSHLEENKLFESIIVVK